MTKVHAIMACTNDHVVGKESLIPWKLSADMKRFKDLTSGHALLIGFRTFMGIVQHYARPVLFPNRTVYVIADFRGGSAYFLNEMHHLGGVRKINFSNIKFISERTLTACLPEDAYKSAEFRLLKQIEALDIPDDQILYIAGGSFIYDKYLPVIDTIELTVVDTFFKKQPKGAFNYDISNRGIVELTEKVKKAMFGFESKFSRQLVGKISKDDKNEYNASYYQLTRSLDGSTPIDVLQGTSAG